MRNSNLKCLLGWLEAGFFLSGLALLAIFFQVRATAEMHRDEGVQVFLSNQARIQKNDSGNGLIMRVKSPDQALWSPQRVNQYEQTLNVTSDSPQAVLTIEKLGLEVPVYDGADEFNLIRGVARIKGTGVVDQAGNLGIAGHRDGFFRPLKDVSLGDLIELKTMLGVVSYRVSSIEIVDPSDVSVLAPTAASTLTLVTCYPFYYVGHAPKRFIVKADA